LSYYPKLKEHLLHSYWAFAIFDNEHLCLQITKLCSLKDDWTVPNPSLTNGTKYRKIKMEIDLNVLLPILFGFKNKSIYHRIELNLKIQIIDLQYEFSLNFTNVRQLKANHVIQIQVKLNL